MPSMVIRAEINAPLRNLRMMISALPDAPKRSRNTPMLRAKSALSEMGSSSMNTPPCVCLDDLSELTDMTTKKHTILSVGYGLCMKGVLY